MDLEVYGGFTFSLKKSCKNMQ